VIARIDVPPEASEIPRRYRDARKAVVDVCSLVPPPEVRQLVRQARDVGATVFLAHNHPSGDPQPSDADMHVTARALVIALSEGVDFGGSYVINHDRLAVIADLEYIGDGLVLGPEPKMMTAPFDKSPFEWTAADQLQILEPEHVFAYLSQIPHDGRRVDVLFLDTQQRVIAFHPMRSAEIADTAKMREMVRQTAAATIIIGVYGQDGFKRAVSAVRGKGLPVLDVVDVQHKQSALDNGLIPEHISPEPGGVSRTSGFSRGGHAMDQGKPIVVRIDEVDRPMILDGPNSHQAYGMGARPGETEGEYRKRMGLPPLDEGLKTSSWRNRRPRRSASAGAATS